MNTNKTNFAFFGSSRLSVIVLEELSKLGLTPTFIVTTADKPVGRKQIVTANVVKQWANENKIPVYSPLKLNQEFIAGLITANKNASGTEKCSVFLVASYGKIIPQAILNIPSKKVLNIHPSLLPKYRGPSPLPTAMLDDAKETGLTIMRMDEEMDHGPIVIQKNITITEWPTYENFEELMAKEGAKLFTEILPKWVKDEIKEVDQDHSVATYTKKITKEDGQIDLNGDPYFNFRRIQAFHEWPQAYFFITHKGQNLRVKITEATFKAGQLTIERVIPEGGKEIFFEDFKRGYKI